MINCLLLISCNDRSKETPEKSPENREIVILLEPGNESSDNILKLVVTNLYLFTNQKIIKNEKITLFLIIAILFILL